MYLLRKLCIVSVFFLWEPVLQAQEWGSLKGRVIWAGTESPALEKVKVDKDQDHCLSKGDINSEKFVVNPKNKGVKWVFAWIVDPKDAKGKIPVHPSLVEPSAKEVVIDQPCCKFEPHVLGLREGQILVAKNSSPIPHNVNLVSVGKNPSKNEIVPPGRAVKVEGWVSATAPTLVKCDIHPWMIGYIRVFNHPYFAITDEDGNFEMKNAPVGEWNLVIWQEEAGWVTGDRKGIPVKITSGENKPISIDLKSSK